MFNIERWKEIFQSIQKNKLRTALSGFTVSLGILIFIILFGLGEGLKNSYSDLFLNEANNVIFIYPGKTTKPYGGFKTNRQIELKNEDVDDIDLATNLEPKEICEALKKYKINYHESGIEHGTITALIEKHKFEITSLREDILTDGRHAKIKFSKVFLFTNLNCSISLPFPGFPV